MKIEDIIKKNKTNANITKALAGKKVTFTTSIYSAGQGITIGTKVTIINCQGSLQAPYLGYYSVQTPIGVRSVYGCELKLEGDTIESIKEDIKDLKKSIEEQKEEVKVLESKIKFMEENKLESYDENVFKAYHTLSIISEGTTTMEKAKAIAELFKS